ncbi:CSM1 [Candida theae]|uniref:Cytochrome c oxidase assembly protein COX16, mitochondrial n=1 Tax=Candida theae TaxID=1198502 RepID=A0AAD5FZN9_9ASCO|nr:CSM1 [Candida theae]KAI5961971.1 CSM1 [Candida theae]
MAKGKVTKATKSSTRPIFAEDVLTQTDPSSIVDLINQYVHTNADVIHAKYREFAEEQMAADHKLIQELQEENARLTEELESRSQFSSPVKKQGNEDVFYSLDILEIMSGLKVTDFSDNEKELVYEMKSSGKELEIHYKLILAKDGSEVTYIPIFDGNEEAMKLLPEYFLDSFSFDFRNLPLFYNKRFDFSVTSRASGEEFDEVFGDDLGDSGFLAGSVAGSIYLQKFTSVKWEKYDQKYQQLGEEEMLNLIENKRKVNKKDDYYRLSGLLTDHLDKVEDDYEIKRVHRKKEDEPVWWSK